MSHRFPTAALTAGAVLCLCSPLFSGERYWKPDAPTARRAPASSTPEKVPAAPQAKAKAPPKSTRCDDWTTPQRKFFPADYALNVDVSSAPVDEEETNRYFGEGSWYAKSHLRADFNETKYGIPMNYFDSAVAGAGEYFPILFRYPGESDKGPYFIPTDAKIEGGGTGPGDHHYLGLDTATCKIYEVYQLTRGEDGKWHGVSGAIFDGRKTPDRPVGWTSADAAGLAIAPFLVKYDEVAAGEISHALRFTLKGTHRSYVPPATHGASSSRDPKKPPMGIRVRLKASYDISDATPQSAVILKALKRYGMILADNGGNGFISGEPNPGWVTRDLRWLFRVHMNDFEVIRHPPARKL